MPPWSPRPWTAPGDNGKEGKAAVYQLKQAAQPIVEFVNWPDQSKTHINFWGAENCAGVPTPQAAGAAESFTVEGLPAGKRCFALKTRDATSNQSPISNVVEVEVK